MYLSIGNDMSVRDKSVIGIFDLDNTSTSRRTREFLESAEQDGQVVLYSSDNRAAIVSTALLLLKTTRNTIGVSVMTLKKKAKLTGAVLLEQSSIANASRYRSRTVPTAGAIIKDEDAVEKQISFDM